MKHTWNNLTEKKQQTIFSLLRESRQVESVKADFTPGTRYSFAGGDFLAVADPVSRVATIPTDEGLMDGKYNQFEWIEPDKAFAYVGKTNKDGVDMHTFRMQNETGQDFDFYVPVADASEMVSRMKPVQKQTEAAPPKSIMPDPDPLGDYTAKNDKFPDGFIGDFEHGSDVRPKGGKASDSVGDYLSDTISGKKEGGEDLSGEDLMGHDKGDPDEFNRETKGGKDKKDAGISDDPLTGKDPKVKYEPSEKELGNTGTSSDFRKHEGVSMEDEEDKKKLDKKDREMNKEEKDDEEEDKKRKDEGVSMEDEEDKKKLDKKDREYNKEEDDAKKDDKEEDKKKRKDESRKASDGDPQKDKEVRKGASDDDDEKAEKEDDEDADEDEKVDEATSKFLQHIGSAVMRGLLDEMSKSGKGKLLKNENFIMEVARRVARIEREGVNSVLPQTLKASLLYPAVKESIDYVDLLMFESAGNYFVVDRLNKDAVFSFTESKLVESVKEAGIRQHLGELKKVENKIIFKVDDSEFKFF